MKQFLYPALFCMAIAISGCVAPAPASPAYDPEHAVFYDVISNIPDGSTSPVIRHVADCGDVTVDIASSTTDIPRHFHRNSNEVAVFISGSGVFTFEGHSKIQMKPGAVLFIPKNQVHSFKNVGGRYSVIRIFAPHYEVNDRIEIKDEKTGEESGNTEEQIKSVSE